MVEYKTFNIDFDTPYGAEKQYYEVATNIGEALEKFYNELEENDELMTKITNIYEAPATYSYDYTDEDGDLFHYCFNSPSELFYELSKLYAFADCYPDFTLENIKCDGRPVYYNGWEPNMIFRFYDAETGELVWITQHEEWNH